MPEPEMKTLERPLENGKSVYLYPIFDGARVAIADSGETFSFDDVWNGEGDPEGWYRHPATGRRRPGGDPAKEFVRR